MERIRKLITRDISLCSAQWWWQVQDEFHRKQMNVGYSDTLIVSDGLCCSLFASESDIAAVQKATFNWLAHSKEYYLNQSAVFREHVRQTRKWLESISNQIQLTPDLFDKLKKAFCGLYPMYRFSFVFPGDWKANLEETLGSHSKKIIQRAYQDRLEVEGVAESIDATLRRLAKANLEKIPLPGAWAKYLTEEEIHALGRGESIPEAQITSRAQGFVFCRGTLTPTRDYHKIFRQNGYVYPEERAEGDSVQGQPAFAGPTIRARVRIILALEQIPSFRTGEVLVTPMTHPDFLPLMRKAAAIITDEGGITCHAAIVSRELKVPCVIGTRVATRLFRDGDLVEVDSKKGIVRNI